MSRLTYTAALTRGLEPLGFVRLGKKDWVRRRGDIQDQVNLQKSWVDGSVTVNLFAKNLETERILNSIPCEDVLGIIMFGKRIGQLIDGYDRWWKNNPNGPIELFEAVQRFGIPWFDRVQTLEDEAALWYGRGYSGSWGKPNLCALAITLFRLGALDEALALFDEPVPKSAFEKFVTSGRCVERWLKAQDRLHS